MRAEQVVYPGSFDPITIGHMDLIERAAGLFGAVIVALYAGEEVRYQWATEQRLAMSEKACAHLSNVQVVVFDGLLADWMAQHGHQCIIRGIRDGDDMSQEWRMAHSNQVLNANIETIFLAASPSVSYVSSTLVRQVMAAGGDPTPFMPQVVLDMVKEL